MPRAPADDEWGSVGSGDQVRGPPFGAVALWLFRSLNSVVLPFRDHQMPVRIVFAAIGVRAGMNREPAGEPVVRRKVLREQMSERHLVFVGAPAAERSMR